MIVLVLGGCVIVALAMGAAVYSALTAPMNDEVESYED